MTRADGMKNACPICHAEPLKPCTKGGRPRKSLHLPRYKAALAAEPKQDMSDASQGWATIENGIADYGNNMRERFSILSQRCESPIERTLLAALLIMADGYGPFNISFMMGDYIWQPQGKFDGIICLYAQAKVGECRVDFMIDNCLCRPPQFLTIECDGHDFHERTKAQAQRDKSRDRAMARDGITVLRFTGSEIFSTADDCADEILSHIRT